MSIAAEGTDATATAALSPQASIWEQEETTVQDPAEGKRQRGWWRISFGGPLRVRRAGEREALLLTIICALDMYTTLWWVVSGQAREANDHLAWTFQYHPVAFVLVKCASCLPALILAPRLAQSRPVFTVWLLRTIIVIYVGYYLLNIR